MKIFVPKYRQDFPINKPGVLEHMMVEVNEQDLVERVIPRWRELDALKFNGNGNGNGTADRKKIKVADEYLDSLFTQNVKEVCPRVKGQLEPFTRRPIMAVHASSKLGADHCREVLYNAAYKTGWLTAKYGFNYMYGGGKSGLMGVGSLGFHDGLKELGRKPDQYSIQVIPASFVVGVESINGLRPANEGLCRTTDAALVMPDFVTRRAILDGRCCTAITLPGGVGSMDEFFDIAVGIKTGLGNTRLYAVNTFIESLNKGFYDDLFDQITTADHCGLQSADIFDHVRFLDTPEAVFEDLISKMEKENALPDDIYAAYSGMHHVRPGEPKKLSSAYFETPAVT